MTGAHLGKIPVRITNGLGATMTVALVIGKSRAAVRGLIMNVGIARNAAGLTSAASAPVTVIVPIVAVPVTAVSMIAASVRCGVITKDAVVNGHSAAALIGAMVSGRKRLATGLNGAVSIGTTDAEPTMVAGATSVGAMGTGAMVGVMVGSKIKPLGSAPTYPLMTMLSTGCCLKKPGIPYVD